MTRFIVSVALSLLVLVGLKSLDPPLQDDPLSTFEIHPDFQIELVAQEPVVADPIDMEIDEYGRLYALEFHSYPDNWSGVDRVVQLRDTDGDGVMDERVIFADSLIQAMGIMRWKNGLIVTAPPDVLYFEDTDGDGRADVRRTLLTGFHTRDGESDVNNPVYGLDNAIYLGNGPRSDSPICMPEHPDVPCIPAESTNRNIRFHPDSGLLEVQSGRTQYGMSFDRWGHLLMNSNRNHIYEEVVASRYLSRNPDLLVANAAESISDHGAATQVFPITEDPDYQILTDVGEITSACGISFYDGGAFPEGWENVTFVGEPAHNLLHADRIVRDGPALVASRIQPHVEFLASTDAFFRPVNTYVGPDGALYVVDYYRRIIEGPTWLSDEVLQSGTLYDGTDQGRIYRITAKGTAPASWTSGLSLGEASNRELVAHLANPNVWWRRNAQRLLVDRNADDVDSELRAMAGGESAVGRLHALWTLQGLGRLDADLIRAALRDDEPGVRENAVRLAELHPDADLEDALLALRDDTDPKVSFQLLLTLGGYDSPEAAEVRQTLLFENIDDEWTQVAALSSPFVEEGIILETVLADYDDKYASFVERLSALTAANRPWPQVQALLDDATAPTDGVDWQAAVLRGLADGLDERDALPDEAELEGLVSAFFDHPSTGVRAAALVLLEESGLPEGSEDAVDRAARIAEDVDATADRRTQAIEFLRLDDPGQHAALFVERIEPTEPAAVQQAAFRALGDLRSTTVTELALDTWPVLTQAVRDAALDAILARPFRLDRINLFLDGLERGIVHPSSIGWLDQVTLMRDIPEDMKQRARRLINGPEEEVREETAAYVSAVKALEANPEAGRAVFYQECARCHALGDIAPGSDLGPDLMSVRGWTVPDIVDQVVQPSKAVARGYDLWRVTLEGGESVQGIISAETANAVTVRDEVGRATTYPRRNIASLENLNASIMPSDFDDRMTHQEMADLVAFIRVGQ